MSLEALFLSDPQGRRYADVMRDDRLDFRAVLALLDDPDRQRRMVEAEIHHKRPALAGVVVELEAIPAVHTFFALHDGRTTIRARQAIGVAVRVIMQQKGFTTTGRKGTLGTRRRQIPASTAPGAYQNGNDCLAKWFTRAEHFDTPKTTVGNTGMTAAEITAKFDAFFKEDDNRLEPEWVDAQARAVGEESW